MKPLTRFCFHFCLCCIAVACNNASDKETSKSDSTVVTVKQVDSVALGYAGTYSGYVPCADCDGIVTYLVLKPDMTYRLEETYAGKSDTAKRYNGTWVRDNKKVVLDDRGSVRTSYLSEDNKLIQLDNEGNRITGNLGNKYMLTKSAPNTENAAWNAKKNAGVDFIGLGNEPFWSIEIDKGKSVSFNTPNMKQPVTIPYADPVVKDGISEYHVETEGTKMDISLFPQFCSDGMSDNLYEYKVVLKYNGKKYNGCGVLLNSL